MNAFVRCARAFALLSFAALATTCSKPRERFNVLLITVDTWRADRLSALRANSERVTTPQLDALARESLVFTHASTPRAKTTPAIASLMTGLQPHEHGVRDLLSPLALSFPTLAERLRAGGWRTGAIVGNYVLLSRYSGLERGFEQWTEDLPQHEGVPPDDVPQRVARSLTDGALTALGLAGASDAGPRASMHAPGEPWFLWLHYMDPHGTYDPPAEHRVFSSPPEALPASTSHQRFVADYNVPEEARTEGGGVDVARVRDLYDGEVHYVDAEIGRLLARLRESGELARTLVVVTSDHGESLGEHDYWFEHGRDAYEATTRVPLVVRFPDAEPARPRPAQRSDDVSLVDLAPTLLAWAGLEPLALGGAEHRGVSLLDAWRGASERRRIVFGEKVERVTTESALQHKTARLHDWKLVQRFAAPPKAAGSNANSGDPIPNDLVLVDEALYDLRADPREEHPIVGEAPEDAPLDELRRALARFVAADTRFAKVAAELDARRLELERTDPRALRVLKGLGY